MYGRPQCCKGKTDLKRRREGPIRPIYIMPEGDKVTRMPAQTAKMQKDLREAPPNKCREIITIVVKGVVLNRAEIAGGYYV